MAFCNSCGTNIAPGTRFCSKCGAAIVDAPAVPSAVPATAVPPITPAPAGGVLKAILIVVGVIALLGIVGLASLAIFASRLAHHARVHQEGNNVKVETPFGTVETTKDPAEAARNLGVDLYPGAEVLKDGAASATFGGVHTVSLNSESTDSVEKVSDFYKAKFPNAMVTTSDAGRCTIISNDHRNIITIIIQVEGGKTKIQITDVSHKPDTTSSSN